MNHKSLLHFVCNTTMTSFKTLIFVFAALFAAVLAEEAVREKKGIAAAYTGFGYGGYGYNGYPYGYSNLGYSNLGYSGLGYSGYGYSGYPYSAGYSSYPYSGYFGGIRSYIH